MNVIILLMRTYYFAAKENPAYSGIAYLATVLNFSVLAWMNTVSIMLFIGTGIIPQKFLISLWAIFFFFPCIFYAIATPSNLNKVALTSEQRKKGKTWFFGWLTLSILLMIASFLLNRS